MAIYGHKFDEYIFETSYRSLIMTIEEDNKFMNSITESTIVTESVISNIVEKIKEIINKVITFLKSIPGKIKALVAKFLKKKDFSIDKNGWPDSDLFNGSKTFDERPLYDYKEASEERLNYLKDITSDPDIKYNPNADYDSKVKDLNDKNIKNNYEDEEYLNKFIIKNTSGKYLKENFGMFKNMTDEIDNIEAECKNIKNKYESLKKSLNIDFSKGNPENLNEKILNYKGYIIRISSALTLNTMTVIAYASASMSQYLAVERFIKSCYPHDVFRAGTIGI